MLRVSMTKGCFDEGWNPVFMKKSYLLASIKYNVIAIKNIEKIAHIFQKTRSDFLSIGIC